MFTGIVQEIGKIIQLKSHGNGVAFTVEAPQSVKELRINDSILINGVCLTVIDENDPTFKVEAVEETLRKTTLGELKPSSMVNLELPLRLTDRLGGHLVQGHVDGVGVVKSIVQKTNSWLITVQIPEKFAHYVIPVGSIAIDGISLTVASMQGLEVTVSIIPHTMEQTTLRQARAGTRVNLEFDLIGKYIERLLHSDRMEEEGGRISREKLKEWGYES
ncbi:MAG: riboflavin synthase [Ignavibacteria bacterium]|nr:riboflavin synthase [Ignavibacteria bacterium]